MYSNTQRIVLVTENCGGDRWKKQYFFVRDIEMTVLILYPYTQCHCFSGTGSWAKNNFGSYYSVILEFVSTPGCVSFSVCQLQGSERHINLEMHLAKKHASPCHKELLTHFKDGWVSEKSFPVTSWPNSSSFSSSQ